MHPLKTAESWLREVRSFVLPAHIVMYRRILRERCGAVVDQKSPVAVLDLRSLQSDADAGRFLYLTYRRLRAAGYSVVLISRFRTMANFAARKYKQLLFQHPWSVAKSDGDVVGNGGIWITDSGSFPGWLGERGWLRIRVSYERRLPMRAAEVAHVFTMHPDVFEHDHLISRERAESGNERWCRIFFGGNTSARVYSRERMGAGHPVLTRVEAVEIARRAAGGALTVLHARDAVRRTRDGGRLGFATIDTGVDSIDAQYWLHVLAGSEFFLAAPGSSFPLSHNAIEAMHAGSIPIIQYPQYFDPALRDGENCLVYRNGEELAGRVKDALAMDDAAIASLRRGAVDYYHRHLSLEPMVHRLRDVAASNGEATLMYFSFTAPVAAAPQ